MVWTAPDGSPCTGAADCSWRAPEAVPEPLWSTFDDADELESARASCEASLALYAAPRLAAAREECGIENQAVEAAAARIWLIPDEMCDFIPGSIPRTGQAAINGAGVERQCVAAESTPEGGTPIWVEVMVPTGESPAAAEEWLSTVATMNSLGGIRADLDIGDRATLFQESERHVLTGIVGPVGYVLYAGTAGGRTGDLEATAVSIVDAYLEWAERQG